MRERINIVTRVEYVKASNVRHFQSSLTGFVKVDADWEKINFVPGTIGFTVEDGKSKSGDIYQSSLNMSVRDLLTNPGNVILKLSFDSGLPIILGDTERPVRISLSSSLTQKALKVSHRDTHYPYSLAT